MTNVMFELLMRNQLPNLSPTLRQNMITQVPTNFIFCFSPQTTRFTFFNQHFFHDSCQHLRNYPRWSWALYFLCALSSLTHRSICHPLNDDTDDIELSVLFVLNPFIVPLNSIIGPQFAAFCISSQLAKCCLLHISGFCQSICRAEIMLVPPMVGWSVNRI